MERKRPRVRFSNIVATAKLIAVGAYLRTESRGAHMRADHPAPIEALRHRTYLTLKDADRIAAETGRLTRRDPMTPSLRPELSPLMIEDLVRSALLEDLGRAGDITTYATIGPEKRGDRPAQRPRAGRARRSAARRNSVPPD